MADFKTQFTASARAFDLHVRPLLERHVGGEIVQDEVSTRLSARLLDRGSGVDCWLHKANGVNVPMSSRITSPKQKKYLRSHNGRMFRVRGNGELDECELMRYQRARAEGGAYPALMVHGYMADGIDSGRLVHAGVLRTDDVLKQFDVVYRNWCEAGRPLRDAERLGVFRNPDDGTLFCAFYWDEMIAAGAPLAIVRPDRVDLLCEPFPEEKHNGGFAALMLLRRAVA